MGILPIDDEDYKAIRCEADKEPRDAVVVRLALETGAKLSELQLLRCGDIDLAASKLALPGRELPLSPPTARVLATYLGFKEASGERIDEEAPLLAADNGTSLSIRTWKRIWDGVLVRAGLVHGGQPKYGFENARRTFGMNSYRICRNPDIVRLLLGNEDGAGVFNYRSANMQPFSPDELRAATPAIAETKVAPGVAPDAKKASQESRGALPPAASAEQDNILADSPRPRRRTGFFHPAPSLGRSPRAAAENPGVPGHSEYPGARPVPSKR